MDLSSMYLSELITVLVAELKCARAHSMSSIILCLLNKTVTVI